MRDLTQGELRYINESANGWQMAIYSKCQTVTPELYDVEALVRGE